MKKTLLIIIALVIIILIVWLVWWKTGFKATPTTGEQTPSAVEEQTAVPESVSDIGQELEGVNLNDSELEKELQGINSDLNNL